MELFGVALQDYFSGNVSAQLTIKRDDGFEAKVPVGVFFRTATELEIDRIALTEFNSLTMTKISEYKEFELTREQLFQIITLSNGIWPHPTKSVNDLATEAFDFAQKNPDPWIRRFVIWEKDRAVAHARVFPRKIITTIGELRIMALSSVCVLKEKRGKGYGRFIMERVFRLIDESGFPLTLFQTGVPGFYRKLGAKNILNTFYNSQNTSNPDQNPWWEENIMIYPASYDFPPGKVDLNGFGY